ncbi:MAG: hypothetical protein AB1640_17110 [bacterium]
MKTRLVSSVVSMLLTGVLAVPITAAAKVDTPQMLKQRVESVEIEKALPSPVVVRCPVTGMVVDKSEFVTHGGHKVYLCCAHCEKPFLGEPEKYLNKHGSTGNTTPRRWTGPAKAHV